MTDPAPADAALPAPPDVVDQIIDLTLQMQTYLADDPDPRAAEMLAAAVDIIDALLAG